MFKINIRLKQSYYLYRVIHFYYSQIYFMYTLIYKLFTSGIIVHEKLQSPNEHNGYKCSDFFKMTIGRRIYSAMTYVLLH